MQKKKLIIANWKMNPGTITIAQSNFKELKKIVSLYKNISTVISAPFVYISELSKLVSSNLTLSVQNISSEKEGAYTGEISMGMIRSMKVKYVIVGHSERRALGETNEFINKKLKAVLAGKLIPVLCIGETNRDHDMWYLSVVKTQLEECLAGISKKNISEVVIAYEPVWALSSTINRRDATPQDFEEMQIYIRKILSDMFGNKITTQIKILYGGSVDEKNAGGFIFIGGADGLLVGRASLNPKKFAKILEVSNNTYVIK